MRRPLSLREVFEDRVERGGSENDCWEWRGYRDHNGYGLLQHDGRKQRAHRISYELVVGPIPEGLSLDHLCRNRGCVNPAHLEPVTLGENVLRGESPAARNARKAECANGHLFDAANTRIGPDGQRICRTCNRQRVYESRARRAAEVCANGHPRTPENTRVSPRGYRMCLDCKQERMSRAGGRVGPERERPTHCPHGHEFTAENTYVVPGTSYRYCRECNRAAARRAG